MRKLIAFDLYCFYNTEYANMILFQTTILIIAMQFNWLILIQKVTIYQFCLQTRYKIQLQLPLLIAALDEHY